MSYLSKILMDQSIIQEILFWEMVKCYMENVNTFIPIAPNMSWLFL